MSADVGGVGSTQTLLAMTAARRSGAAPGPTLRLPEEQPFEVATINQRLASLAAERAGAKLDVKV